MRTIVFLTLTILSVKSEVYLNSYSIENEYEIFDKKTERMAKILNNNSVNETLYPRNNNNEVVQKLSEAINSLWTRAVIVLIDDREQVHRDAEIIIKKTLNLSYREIDFGLMKFNNTGVTPVLVNTLSNKELFFKLLKWDDKVKEPQTSMVISPDITPGGVLFFALTKAARTLPDNSGIIIFTDRGVEDEDLAQLAMKEVFRKHIRLYVVWTASRPNFKQPEKLIQEAAVLTGGKFFVSIPKTNLSVLYNDLYYEHPDSKQTKAVIAFYNNITGRKRLNFPINSDVTSIHISVTSTARYLHLISPGDYSINLLNSTEVEHFSEGSFNVLETKPNRYEIQLSTMGNIPTSIVGTWRLDVDAGAQSCNVTISVQTHLNITTYIVDAYDTNAVDNIKSPKTKKVLRVSVSGNVGKIENITLLDSEGFLIEHNIMFTSKYVSNLENLEESEDQKKEVDIELKTLPKEPFYLRVSGEDREGTTYSRLSYFDREKINYVFQSITVEVGAGSELLVMSNQQAKVYFEVTNNRDQVMYVYFMVQDERSLLSRLEPRASWLNPKQTVIVTVTTHTPSGAGTNFRDVITFTVSGPERVQKSAAMYVGTNRIIDNEEPRMTHRYTSDCTDILLGDCQGGTWVIEVTAEDRESGLLQLTSSPKGLYFPNSYIAGTKEPVVGIYGGSCCQPKIQLTAIDMQNNRRTYTADAYFATLSAGSIAAIVLGIILLIILIVAIVILCRTKCCKKKESVDLPTYRSPHGNTQSRY